MMPAPAHDARKGHHYYTTTSQAQAFVYSSDEPQTGTLILLCYHFDSLNKRGADAVRGQDAVDGDDFAVVVLDGIGQKAKGFVILKGNEAVKGVRVVYLAVTDNN